MAILAKRGIIRPSPFAYPGTKPGFDPSHIAFGTKPLCSAVAFGAGMVNLYTGVPGTQSTNNKPTAVVLRGVGPAMNVAGSDSSYSIAGDTSDVLSFTMGAIIHLTSVGAAQSIFRNHVTTSTGDGFAFDVGATNVLRLYTIGVTTVTSTVTLAAGVPYFVAVSNGGAANISNFIAINLLNGVIQTQSTTGITTDTAPSGSAYMIGNRFFPTGGANPLNGAIAAMAFTNKFMTLPMLSQWASSPWSFWYPAR